MKTKTIMMGLSALLAVSSYAQTGGDRGGNGGDAFVCRDKNNKITSAELWEYHEAKNVGKTNYLDARLSVEENINLVLDQLKRLHDTDLVTIIQNEMEVLLQKKPGMLFSKVPLANIQDSKEVITNQLGHCQSEQVAIRLSEDNRSLYDADYLVDEEVFNKLNSLDRAGLILHEAIYKLSKDENSVRPRGLNLLITSPQFKGMNFIEYFLKRSKILSGIDWFNYEQQLVSTKEVEVRENSLVASLYEDRTPDPNVWNPNPVRPREVKRKLVFSSDGLNRLESVMESGCNLMISAKGAEFSNDLRSKSLVFDLALLKPDRKTDHFWETGNAWGSDSLIYVRKGGEMKITHELKIKTLLKCQALKSVTTTGGNSDSYSRLLDVEIKIQSDLDPTVVYEEKIPAIAPAELLSRFRFELK